MGSFRANEVDNYGGNGGAGFFSLKNDKDVARVRFLYDGPEDLEGYAVHQVEVDGKKRYVNCLRSYKDPVDQCPFCREKKFQVAKLFIPLYNIDEDSIQVWERGKNFFSKMTSQMARYPEFVKHVFEVERNGKPHDTQTTYEMFEIGKDDDVRLEDFDMPNILGSIILDKTADEMEYYLENDEFPSDNTAEEPVRRRNTRDDGYSRGRDAGRDRGRDAGEDSAEEPRRRTPQREGRNRGF